MPYLEKYIELEEEETNNNENNIKTYKAKREYLIKEIKIKDDEEKLVKLQLIKDIANENNIQIYDIIENENSICIVIDLDKEKSLIFDQLLLKAKETNLVKEKIIKGNGNYLTLSDIEALYKEGRKMTKINVDRMKGIYGSGFLLEINEDNIPIKKVLFTCNHVLNEEYLKSNNKIEIKNQAKINHINIKNNLVYRLENYIIKENNANKRKIITDKFLDYTCIEIFDNDFENDIDLFDINKKEIKINKDIFILHHPQGQDILSYSLGQILKIQDSIIYHSASTERGSSGSPIINREDFSVIGIHYGGINNNFNTAHNIKDILDDIKSKILNINNISNIIEKLKEDKIINKNNNKYLKKKQMHGGKLGVIYKSRNLENEKVIVISIDLFKYYENNKNKEENIIIREIKDMIDNIKKSDQKLYDIYIEDNSLNIVIEKYEDTFDNYFTKKDGILNFEELKSFISQLNQYIKIYKDLNINLNYISFKNILVKNENENTKYQFLFYYNKIILDKKNY